MHDGSYDTLDDVLFFYLRGVSSSRLDGLPLDVESIQGISLDEKPDLIAFLEALSGDEPKIAPPELP
jgi:cytochrome c peroxidase